MRQRLWFVIGLACLLPAPVQGWNKPGHMVSGAIAYRVLQEESPTALARAVELLKTHPYYENNWEPALQRPFVPAAERDLYLFMLAARWADDARDDSDFYPQGMHLDRWHYINIPFLPPGHTVKTTPANPDTNLLVGYEVNLGRCKGDKDADDRAVALTWLMHLIGDVHQPLHTTSLFTDQFTEGDHGGTRFFVRGKTDVIHLHHYWDGLIIGTPRFQDVRKRAIALHGRDEFKLDNLVELKEASFQNWAIKESLPLAKEKAYFFQGNLLKGSPTRQGAVELPDGYSTTVQPIAERRIVLAGYRIARTLKNLFE